MVRILRMIRIPGRLLGMEEEPRVVQSGWAGRHMRDLLDAAQRGEATQVNRYQTPIAVVVPFDWFEEAREALKSTK